MLWPFFWSRRRAGMPCTGWLWHTTPGPARQSDSGTKCANVAELVDALDLGSSGVTRGSSSLPIRTTNTGFPGRD